MSTRYFLAVLAVSLSIHGVLVRSASTPWPACDLSGKAQSAMPAPEDLGFELKTVGGETSWNPQNNLALQLNGPASEELVLYVVGELEPDKRLGGFSRLPGGTANGDKECPSSVQTNGHGVVVGKPKTPFVSPIFSWETSGVPCRPVIVLGGVGNGSGKWQKLELKLPCDGTAEPADVDAKNQLPPPPENLTLPPPSTLAEQPQPQPTAAPVAQPPTSEPTPDAAPAAPLAAPAASLKSAPAPTPEPTPQPAPQPSPQPAPQSTPQSTPEPTPEPTSESVSAPPSIFPVAPSIPAFQAVPAVPAVPAFPSMFEGGLFGHPGKGWGQAKNQEKKAQHWQDMAEKFMNKH